MMASCNDGSEKYSDLSLFSGIKMGELAPMLQCLGGRTKLYKRNDFIALSQEEINYVGIVLSGTIHMIHEDTWNDTSILAVIRKGELFGETFACGTDLTSCVSFMAAENTKAMILPFHKVLHSCSQACPFHQQLIENMVTMLADKNAQLMKKLQVTSKKTLRKKILTFLSFQSQRSKNSNFSLSLNRTELADYVCANRTALARELARMKKDGLIDFDHNTFTLL